MKVPMALLEDTKLMTVMVDVMNVNAPRWEQVLKIVIEGLPQLLLCSACLDSFIIFVLISYFNNFAC